MLLTDIEVVCDDIQPIKIRALTLDGSAFEHIFELPRLNATGWRVGNGPFWTNSVCCKKVMLNLASGLKNDCDCRCRHKCSLEFSTE